MTDLKPCPFCGHEDINPKNPDGWTECNKCMSLALPFTWNTRVGSVQQKWVSVKDCLPPPNHFVLTRSPSGYVNSEWTYSLGMWCPDYNNGSWLNEGGDHITCGAERVSHWMEEPK